MTTDILTLNTPTNFQDASGIELIRLFALNLKDQYMVLMCDEDEIDPSVAMTAYDFERELISAFLEFSYEHLEILKPLFTEELDEKWLRYFSEDDPKVGALQCVLHLQTTILDTLEITEDEKNQEANEQE